MPPSASRIAIFFPPRRAAGEEHVREIEAGDEQHDRRHAGKKRADRVAAGLAVTGSVLVEKRSSGAVDEGLVFLLDRKGLLQIRRETFERGRCGRGGEPGFQPADQQKLIAARSASKCLFVPPRSFES